MSPGLYVGLSFSTPGYVFIDDPITDWFFCLSLGRGTCAAHAQLTVLGLTLSVRYHFKPPLESRP